ncbi:hypothetical protein ES332_A06G056100v1 [Gossypium tomentosum]|uniref:Uncharacterized protein n=1 Tax=Gossypium tomentosum TaxID=34277 RepID=A0A5D2Q0C7_GOSTO|nr:hypothetical protein ES332_A06G056100v1 [Gossypium tomentosum]
MIEKIVVAAENTDARLEAMSLVKLQSTTTCVCVA